MSWDLSHSVQATTLSTCRSMHHNTLKHVWIHAHRATVQALEQDWLQRIAGMYIELLSIALVFSYSPIFLAAEHSTQNHVEQACQTREEINNGKYIPSLDGMFFFGIFLHYVDQSILFCTKEPNLHLQWTLQQVYRLQHRWPICKGTYLMSKSTWDLVHARLYFILFS